MLDISERLRAPVIAVCLLVVIGWVSYFVFKAQHGGSRPKYGAQSVDEVVGWFLAQEAVRLGGSGTHVVLFFSEHENNRGSTRAQSADAYGRGFQSGLFDEKGNPRKDVKILAKKYKTDDPNATMDPWPSLALIEEVARQYPQCNVMVSFCDAPRLKANNPRPQDSAKLPHVLALSRSRNPPEEIAAIFSTGVVELLCTALKDPPKSWQTKTPREVVEVGYWIVTKENLQEMLTKMAGG